MKTFKTTINVIVNDYNNTTDKQKFDTSRLFVINAQKLVAIKKITDENNSLDITLNENIKVEGLKSVPLRTFDNTTIDGDTKQGCDNFFLGDLDNYDLFFIDWAITKIGTSVQMMTLDDYKATILKSLDPLKLDTMSKKEE